MFESMPASRRIRRGFHRLGIFLAVPCLVLAAALLAMAAYNYIVHVRNPECATCLALASEWLLYAGLAGAAGALAYLASRGLGWVVAGFLRA